MSPDDRSRALTKRVPSTDSAASTGGTGSWLGAGPRRVGVHPMAEPDPGTMRGPMGNLEGQLLVASPAMSDPNFARTVVAIANHDEEGALGIVLNRPSDTEVVEAVP